MATDININQLIINKLTKAQYQAAKEAGQIIDTELYVITDDEDYLDEKYAPLYTYGTEDIGASGTVLETGKLHFVYEVTESDRSDTPSTPTVITFTIEGTTYQAEEGMTWAEWIESEYNTIGSNIKILDNTVCDTDAEKELCEDYGEFALSGYVIESGKSFHWE